MNGWGVVHLMAKADLEDKNGWAITINKAKGALESGISFPTDRAIFFFMQAYPSLCPIQICNQLVIIVKVVGFRHRLILLYSKHTAGPRHV